MSTTIAATAPTNPKLRAAQRERLQTMLSGRTFTTKGHRLVLREDAAAPALLFIVEGWARCYKMGAAGERQIVEFLVPGDALTPLCEGQRRMDYSIDSLTPLKLAIVGLAEFQSLLKAMPSLALDLLEQRALRQRLLREWLLLLGRRPAMERVAHLLCEIFLRLERRGLTESNECAFPPTQTDIADATGLTSVHVNRTVQKMRRANLIVLDNRRLCITDMTSLQRLAVFDLDGLRAAYGEGEPEGPQPTYAFSFGD
jgi:CRP-like cAMP-binding protein